MFVTKYKTLYFGRLRYFIERNRTILLRCNGFVLPLLVCLWRTYLVYFENKPLSTALFDISVEIGGCLDFFLFCSTPSAHIFVLIYKKANTFIAMLFGKISYFIAFLLWITIYELLHCQYILSGFCFYVFFVYSYFYLSSTLWPLHFFLSKLIVKCVIFAPYLIFRSWLGSEKNILIKAKFAKLDEISIQLQQKNTILVRIFFIQ